MKPKLLLCLALVVSGVLIGCQTERVEASRSIVTNLHGDGRSETNVPVTVNRGLFEGMTRLAVFLDNPPSSVVIYYPTNTLNHLSQVQIDAPLAYAWLVRTQLDYQTLRSAKRPTVMPFKNSEPLHGKIEVAQYDWRHKDLFHFAWDLTGEDGVALKGEWNEHTKTKFAPNQLWITPYMVFVMPFFPE